MEINITHFAKTAEMCELSGSQSELGKDAAKITWNNAKREAQSSHLITEDDRDEFEAWVRGFGAWEDAEIKAWTLDECNALLIQYIAGDMRTLEGCGYDENDEYGIDWKAVNDQLDGGNGIYKGDDEQLYFYMGN